MKNFEKYQHVERYDKSCCAGLLEGECYIFPKLDGTNASAWYGSEYDGLVGANIKAVQGGSRKRELSLTSDNAGFLAYIKGSGRRKYERFFNDQEKVRLFGEWLVPHTIKGYREDAWRKFYIFDVIGENGEHVKYDDYAELLTKHYEIEVIPPLAVVKNPTPDRLVKLAKENTYLMEDGQIGEGIVIKNYDFVNRYGRVQWGKLVLNEFKDKMNAGGIRKIQETKSAAENIVARYVTKSLVEKELAKLYLEDENMEKKRLIPNLFNNVYDDLMSEMGNISREFKRPMIDFKQLFYHMTVNIREFLPEIFS